jgi:hypothetical protein
MTLRPARLAAAAVVATLASLASEGAPAAAPIDGRAPYQPSDLIERMDLDWSTYRHDAQGSDNWPTTWAADGNVYTSWGDGGGFGRDANARAYVSLGFAKLEGSSARTVRGTNLVGGLDPRWGRCFPLFRGNFVDRARRHGRAFPCYGRATSGKSRSVLALGDTLYSIVTPDRLTAGYEEARIYKTRIGRSDWQRAPWAFESDGRYPIIFPAFVQAGRDHRDAADGWIYAYATRYAPTVPRGQRRFSLQRGPRGGEVTLLRVPRGADVMDRRNWSFFSGTAGAGGAPSWTADQDEAEGVFFDRNGVGWVMSAIYVKALDRYLLLTANTVARAGRLGVHESESPWGPWRTVYYSTVANPQRSEPPDGFYFNFLANSFSGDGRRFTLVFTGKGRLDSLNLVDGSFTLDR